MWLIQYSANSFRIIRCLDSALLVLLSLITLIKFTVWIRSVSFVIHTKFSLSCQLAHCECLRKNITKPNYALDRRTVLCLYVPGFQRQVIEYVPKCKWIPLTKLEWIPLTKLEWIPRTNTCNVNFVGTLILSRILQRKNIGNCSGFRKCKRIPQM